MAAAVLAAVVLGACGGGGGGGGGGGNPMEPVPGITLNATAPTGAGIALGRSARSTTSLLVLEVRASQVTGLYGVAFDLTYPGAALDFTAFRPGDFLTANGAAVSTQVFESAPGNLVVGVTRVGNVGGADGSGVLIELELQAAASGTGNLSFRENAAFRADGTQLALSWAGGSVAVVR
jgi:hypothetical protein